jgi:hypothetical protein
MREARPQGVLALPRCVGRGTKRQPRPAQGRSPANGANMACDGPRDGTPVAQNHTKDPRHGEFLVADDGRYQEGPHARRRVGLRRIMDASAPAGNSINDGIEKVLAKCQTWPQVLEARKRAGPRARLTKRDIKSGFSAHRHTRSRSSPARRDSWRKDCFRSDPRFRNGHLTPLFGTESRQHSCVTEHSNEWSTRGKWWTTLTIALSRPCTRRCRQGR